MEAAAKNSHEGKNARFIFIILGIPNTSPAGRKGIAHPEQPMQAAGKSNSAYCRDDFTCH
jgi:hypothetical protein